MDVLKFGEDCTVLAPEAFRLAVAKKLSDSIANYAREAQLMSLAADRIGAPS